MGEVPFPQTMWSLTVNMLTDLVRILENVCRSGLNVALLRAALLVAFFGAFGMSELVPGSCRDSTGRALDLWARLWQEYAVILNFLKSKTDQESCTKFIFLQEGGESGVCPAEVLRAYIVIRLGRDGPLFMHDERSPLR